MHRKRSLACLLAAGLAVPFSLSAEQFLVHVQREALGGVNARTATVISIPYAAVRARLSDARFDHVQVRRADTGALLPFQITNFTPNVRPAQYDDLLWQFDFAAGESAATFIVESSPTVVPPFPARVFARYVPERLDDFAWENDLMAHRAYGPALNTSAAGQSQLRSAGLDYWAKRVRYPIVDRWYLKGHDAYHVDSGEGLDMYSVGSNAGVGGTMVWQGGTAHSAGNWVGWRVLANGPLRAVFELDYAPVALTGGGTLQETKRFTVDAGSYFDRIESRFTLVGAESAAVAVGLTRLPDSPSAGVERSQGELLRAGFPALWNWSTYQDKHGDHGALGTAVIVAEPRDRDLDLTYAEDGSNDYLVAPVTDGTVLTAYAGGAWSRAGEIRSAADWQAQVLQRSGLLTNETLTITFDPAQ